MGDEYRRVLMDFETRFASEQASRAYLFRLRWPEGFICPRCAEPSAWQMSRGLWLCRGCRRQVSVISGTIFQDSKLPLMTWFRARSPRLPMTIVKRLSAPPDVPSDDSQSAPFRQRHGRNKCVSVANTLRVAVGGGGVKEFVRSPVNTE